MAVEAGRHYECIHLRYDVHILHLAVACLAFNAAVNVYAVIKVNEVRDLVNPFPWDGLVVFIVLSEPDNLRSVLTSHTVAVHAGTDRRNHGMT